ncbi:hypothetical protein ACH5RR_019990 [Cinchona calisaya]|uniref:Two-component response regulator n=1 Tax=Cinchona calisaya TaxID=153742 RepID=A0ABD2ZD49_9GENT
MFGADQGSIKEPFPAGLRVLIVDDDPTSLLILERLLLACHYQGSFDIVMSDLYMPGIDGLQLLEIIRSEMDLPVIMMSIEDRKDIVMKIIIKGACDYLIKPIRMEEIRVIWQHVVRKRRNNISKSYMFSKFLDCVGSDQEDDHHSNFETNIHGDSAFSGNKENNQSSKGKKDEKDDNKDVLVVSKKKPRMIWTTELHDQFVAVVNHMGLKNAVPKKILELMNVPGLTRENVASHLQKYRLHLRMKNENKQMKSRMGVAPMHFQNAVQYPSCLGDTISKQIESQSSVVFSESEAPNLDEQISRYNQRLTSQQIFETGRQQSWYHHGTAEQVMNHLPSTTHAQPVQGMNEDGSVLLLERLLQSSAGIVERSNELAINGMLSPDNYATMRSLVDQHEVEDEIEIEDVQNGSDFDVNGRDFDYAFCSIYDQPMFIVEQHSHEDGLQLLTSSQQS